MRITARTPNRIDLAGGTLDLYPLYLIEDGGLTINLAVEITSQIVLEPQAHGIRIVSRDTGQCLEAPAVDDLPLGGPLDLVVRTLRHYRPQQGLAITLHNAAPHGSGLGASSSLLIALLGALNVIAAPVRATEQLIDLAANLEAQVIGMATGKQDYYAAAYGGLNALWFGVEKTRVEALSLSTAIMDLLTERTVLSFTGVPHRSAVTNWSMMKAYIEDDGETRRHMRRIKETAFALREALLADDAEGVVRCLAEEWENRRSLAEGVSTPGVERLMQAAREAGALASKLCGAGGGGCMVTMTLPGRREAVAAALTQGGAAILPFTVAQHGLNVTVDPMV